MKHLTVGVFHDDAIGRELGKKDTESDILMFNRKIDEHIFTFMHSIEDRLPVESQIVSCIDAAIVTFTEPTRELGETVVMLDLFGLSKGVILTSPYATSDQIATITKGTSLESFTTEKRDTVKVLAYLKGLEPQRDTQSPAVVVVDHSFSVRGVGEVILGFVKKGIVKKHDTFTLLPAKREVTVRSVQIQDEDCDQAEAGSRAGLAIKGAAVEDMKRGSLLCNSAGARTETTIELSLEKSPFYSDEIKEGDFHMTVGMQTVPITITKKTKNIIVVKSEKSIAYMSEEQFLLLDLNAEKMRIMGRARALEN